MQILKLEIVAHELKNSTIEQQQLQLQNQQLQMDLIKLKLKSDADAVDNRVRQEKLDADIEMQERNNKLKQQRVAAEISAQQRRCFRSTATTRSS